MADRTVTIAELRELTVQLRQARNAGRWQTESNLWASLSEALDELEKDEFANCYGQG
jgi:hypothetical protein